MSHETSTASTKQILSAWKLLPGLLPLGAHRREGNQWLEVSSSWSCMFTQKRASTDDKAAPSKTLLVLLLWLGYTGGLLGPVLGLCWYSGWRRQKVALISLWHSLPEAVTICQKAVQQPQGFYFLYLLCYCNAVHIWASFWCRMSTSALC